MICLSTFTLIRTLEELEQKKNNETIFKCHICNKTYRTENGLKKHMETKHKDGEKV